MIIIPAFFEDTGLNQRISIYINEVLQGIIQCNIDLIRDSKKVNPDEISYVLQDIFPPVMLREDPGQCEKRLYELYDIIASPVIRIHIKPVYHLVLFRCIEGYLEFRGTSDSSEDFPLDPEMRDQIIKEYGFDAVRIVTDIESYLESLFDDWDFLPDYLNLYVALSINDPSMFRMVMTYEELDEYLELMDMDLREEYVHFRQHIHQPPETAVQKLHRNILKALISIQNNRLYYGKSENEINDGVRDNLNMVYDVRDQTRRGESESGKSSGELDFLFYEDGIPIAIAEALKLNGLNRTYLETHIEKVLKAYNPVGYQDVFLLVYATVSDFGTFWRDFMTYVADYDYGFSIEAPIRDTGLPYAESKHAIIVLNRNGKPVNLSYYVIHIT